MKYKMAEDGKIVVDEKGNPVVVDDDEKEFGLDAIHLYSKIPSLQAEAKKYREAKEQLENEIKKFEKIKDPEKALKALEKVQNLDDSQLISLNEVEKLKESLIRVEQEKLEELKKNMQSLIEEKDSAIGKLKGDIYKTMVSSQFQKSSYFNGTNPKTILLPDIAESYFGKYFRIEKVDGATKIVGYFDEGGQNKIYSKEKAGELAGFEEAIGEIILKHPMRESILKPSTGAGSPGSNNRRSSTFEKKQIEGMKASERLKYLRRKTA